MKPTTHDLKRIYTVYPDAGVGLLLGEEGGVIDLEIDGSQGFFSLLKLFAGKIPQTMGWSSTRGPHWIFRYDARLAGKDVLMPVELPGLEIRIGRIGSPLQSNCPPTGNRAWNGCEVISELPQSVVTYLAALQPEQLRFDDGSGNADDLEYQETLVS